MNSGENTPRPLGHSSPHPCGLPSGRRVGLRRVAFVAGLALVALTISLTGTVAGDAPEAREEFEEVSHDYQPPVPGTYQLPPIKMAADGKVLDVSGTARRLHSFTRDSITLMSFIYTRCSASRACPYATGVMREVHELTAKDSRFSGKIRLVSLSFDPEVDTPDRMANYAAVARERENGSPWHFLTTRSRADLEPILKAYNQAVDRAPSEDVSQQALQHTLRVFLIDRKGQVRNIYDSETLDLRLVTADIQTLLMEDSHAGAR